MEYKGINIEVNRDGQFLAYIGEDSITAESFKEIKKQIAFILKPKIRIKAFYVDPYASSWDEPKLLEEVEITSYAGDNCYWVISIEKKVRRKACANDLYKDDKKVAERIFVLNKTIKEAVKEIDELKENNHYTNSEILEKLKINTQKLENSKGRDTA